MNDADRFKLLHGPYAMPRCRVGNFSHLRRPGGTSVDSRAAILPG